jgi:hypothetical protein
MKPENLTPLFRGALALRFPVEWVPVPGAKWQPVPGTDEKVTGDTRPKLAGIQVVEVLAVHGGRVTWTNWLPSKFQPGQPATHTCDRRELIALDALEYLPAAEDEKSAASAELAGASAS